jgi:hypothetical protein
MLLQSSTRKAALTMHVTTSVGWLGAVVVFLAMAVAGVRSRDADLVRAAYVAMDLVARLVIVPLAFGALLTGLVSALGTPWGLVRHYWVLVKFALIVVATVVLLLQLAPIGFLAAEAARTDLVGDQWFEARISLVVHACGGLLFLLGATVLAIYKPRGMTRYGQHRQNRAERALP